MCKHNPAVAKETNSQSQSPVIRTGLFCVSISPAISNLSPFSRKILNILNIYKTCGGNHISCFRRLKIRTLIKRLINIFKNVLVHLTIALQGVAFPISRKRRIEESMGLKKLQQERSPLRRRNRTRAILLAQAECLRNADGFLSITKIAVVPTDEKARRTFTYPLPPLPPAPFHRNRQRYRRDISERAADTFLRAYRQPVNALRASTGN